MFKIAFTLSAAAFCTLAAAQAQNPTDKTSANSRHDASAFADGIATPNKATAQEYGTNGAAAKDQESHGPKPKRSAAASAETRGTSAAETAGASAPEGPRAKGSSQLSR